MFVFLKQDSAAAVRKAISRPNQINQRFKHKQGCFAIHKISGIICALKMFHHSGLWMKLETNDKVFTGVFDDLDHLF